MANASRLFQERIEWSNSVLCLGFDFRPEHVPACFYKYGPDGYLEGERSMISYLHAALFAVQDHVACIKPNIAFFEALGMDGLYALQALNGMARNTEVPVILDAKRGDIGSTNEAYAKAYLNPTGFGGSAPIDHIYCDGLTINPFLGTDSLTPYLAAAEVGEKALFFLVSTSNRDGAMVQQATTKDGKTVKEVISHWIHERYKTRNFVSKGLSGLGAVVGATDPEEARAMRELLPNSLFLVPGYGSQGASAADALAGIRPGKSKELAGVLVNSSRAIFEITDSAMLAKDGLTRDDFCELIRSRVKAANAELLEAFEGVRS